MDARTQNSKTWLGQLVHVQVDRPVGYRHGSIVYPINYGFLPGVMAADGEEQDVYILGVTKPITSFDGRIIAFIRRHNDNEDKLVAAPEGMVFHQAQIAEAVYFQEQYFDSSVHSMFQKSCGVVPYRRKGNDLEFLLLFQRFSQSWSFPKGRMDRGETEEETALREMWEETGLRTVLVPNAKAIAEYAAPNFQKQVVLFLGEVQGELVIPDREIEDYRWVRYDEVSHYLQPSTYAAFAELTASL